MMEARKTENGLHVVACGSWDEFISAIRIRPDGARTRIFRGQSEEGESPVTLIEKVDTVLSMSGRSMTQGEIIGTIRELFAERSDREALRRALREHPGVVTEGITYRIDPNGRADWLAERFKLI